MVTVIVRYFAGVAESAGVSEETLHVEAGATLADVIAILVERHGEMFGMDLAVCALMVNGQRFNEHDVLPEALTVEIDALPPFAGG